MKCPILTGQRAKKIAYTGLSSLGLLHAHSTRAVPTPDCLKTAGEDVLEVERMSNGFEESMIRISEAYATRQTNGNFVYRVVVASRTEAGKPLRSFYEVGMESLGDDDCRIAKIEYTESQ